MMSAPAEKREKRAHVFKRDALDFYVEERRASEALFAVEKFVGPVWDPACGSGNIVRAAHEAGLQVSGSDLRERMGDDLRRFFAGVFDFNHAINPAHLPRDSWQATNIVTNPPFFRGKGTEAFIRKALQIAQGKVAVFASIKFLAGAQRAKGLFADHCPHRIWVITPRVSCPPGEYLLSGGKAGQGTDDWVWLVWDLTAPPAATAQFGWLRKRDAKKKSAEARAA